MNTGNRIHSVLHRLRNGFFFWKATHESVEPEPALRSALFSAEQMESYGEELAAQHELRDRPGPDRLLARLGDNEIVLSNCCKIFSTMAVRTKTSQHITPAGEWLLDNYWMVEEQIHTSRKHLPKGYSLELPQLATGPSAGLPRVYDIALENIAHGDGRLDNALLSRFVTAYQKSAALTLGELWAIPIMLRLALIENLRRVSTRVKSDWHDQKLAVKWADRLIETAGKDRKSVILTVAEMANSNPPMSSAFVAELARRLQGQGAALSLPLGWIEEFLSEQSLSIDQLVQLDTQQQAADQVSISNSMSSLRMLASEDWREFVESISVVERVLRKEPAGIYASMDFSTRDHYRHIVESLAKKYQLSEESVAQTVLDLARSQWELYDDGAHPAELSGKAAKYHDVGIHVGYYLMDSGLPTLKKILSKGDEGKGGSEHDNTTRSGVLDRQGQLSFSGYLGVAILLTVLVGWPFISGFRHSGWNIFWLVLLSLPTYLVASQVAIKLVSWMATLLITPHFMPRLDYKEGVPPEDRCLVVIPTMIGEAKDVHDLLEKLEVHYLANRDRNLQFGLLTDFKDAAQETLEQDAKLLELAEQGIDDLNRRYPAAKVDSFFLCHRPRFWNESEGVWMGYERKRGKLCEFNKLLRGVGSERFLLLAGNTINPALRQQMQDVPPVRYVITLDADTLLPRDAARNLIGTMAHPLNRPVYDPEKKRVTSGYAIMQPRVGVTLPSSNRSNYARLFCSDAGIDPYTRNVSDVYQDLFRQGSYIGKGIYDVEAFERTIEGRFQDNCILSHDLIEGCYARSGLVTDVLLYEDYPSCYSADVKRRHRWIRGDWQIMPWILPWVTIESGEREQNPLSALHCWKIIDNLRRSLVPISLLAMLLLGWFGVAWPVIWTAGLLGLVFAVPVLSAVQAAFRKPADISLRRHLFGTARSLGQQGLRSLLMLICLPYEALFSTDAVVRTLWRMFVSKQLLLQWSPSIDAERASAKTLVEHYLIMAVAPVFSIVVTVLLLIMPGAMVAAAPLLLLWVAAPAIVWQLSKPRKRRTFAPTTEQKQFLRRLARKTWAFFDTYVGADDNWLPPDNLQESPKTVVARRTSPTNMGISLLAHMAAHDFGYISMGRMLNRLEKSLGTMSRLEKFRDHFYNWYDTQTLQPLLPQYISTVDSGNLAGHLMTLRQGLLTLPEQPLFEQRIFDGIADAAQVLTELLAGTPREKKEWQSFLNVVADVRHTTFYSVQGASEAMRIVLEQAEQAESVSIMEAGSDAAFWFAALLAQCRDILAELLAFAIPPEGLDGRKDLMLPTLKSLVAVDVRALPPASRERVEAIKKLAAWRLDTINTVAQISMEMSVMDFGFLYDRQRDLLSIGYNINEQRLDASFYDLLASEARLTYFVAIAQGQLPQESWFSLGRLLTGTGGRSVLISWSGSMFEYLMPMLVMPSYEGTLLDETCLGAVKRQIEYGADHKLPWGISESGYNMQDGHFNYQYRAFGVPALGLKRGLREDMVVAPYASIMALMVEPEAACKNLQNLAAQGLAGRFGMYEAVDYTSVRLPRDQDSAIINSFMAHHQGMSLLSLANVLLGHVMQKRFLAEPYFQATKLLLEERMPQIAPEYVNTCKDLTSNAADTGTHPPENKLRVIKDPNTAQPSVQLLSNGRYHVMVSSGGGGYSRFRDMAVTRWHEDSTRDNWGMFCYLREVASGHFWSATYQPVCRTTELYEAILSEARAEFRVRERAFDSHTEIAVSPEDDIELRRINITNRSRERRTIELTSYSEIVLQPPKADAQHPAFGNLFVETEIEASRQAILCSRRPRSANQPELFMFHLLAVHGADTDAVYYETDRNLFIGRDRSLADPAAMDTVPGGQGRLSGTQGAVLDPIASIRVRITLDAGQSVSVNLVSGVSENREGCLALVDKFRDKRLADRVFDMAWTHSQVLLHQFNASLFDAHLYEQMASSVLYANAALRAGPGVLKANMRGQSGLWGQSISGDNPVVLLKIGNSANIDLVTQMVKAHAYWRLKGLTVDLIIWNGDHHSYRQNLQDLILSIIPSAVEGHLMDRPGGIFVRSAQQMSREDRILIQTVARLIITDTGGTLSEQVYRRRASTRLPGPCAMTAQRMDTFSSMSKPNKGDDHLILSNQFGGFTPDGSEYVITLKPESPLPAPWVNVLANPDFGTIVSESGSAYTWRENAHEFRLTPWMNDPVGDTCGEALYLRDEVTGHYWSPTPLPKRGSGVYTVRHGFGYSVFGHTEDGIQSELQVFVAKDAPVKFYLWKLRNMSGHNRRLSATGYVEWVLGDLRSNSAMHVITEPDPVTGTIFAHNAYTMDFPGRTAFFDVSVRERTFSCDRTEFMGRNGNLENPAAMKRSCLSGRSTPGMDPCASMQTVFELKDGDNRALVFILGAAATPEEAFTLAQKFGDVKTAEVELSLVRSHWKDILGAVKINTPDQAVNVLANGWLMYQSIACRYQARSGFYQSGGAFGFRDQLQDSMAMVYAMPQVARHHLLLCAAHQFPEGDVQHWWHPPLDRGVRTRCSDDYLWLPLATERYVRITGDTSVLDEPVGYIEARALNDEEESFYDLPMHSSLQEPLYAHCVRAIRHGLRFGERGLPLMGGGDWNDGMDQVGIHGKGESVWLGFFLYHVLLNFAHLAADRHDEEMVKLCATESETLRENLEVNGWDGAWYRRAYFDDGTPLGSAGSDECRIDSIAQSWAVISGAPPDWRQRKAMDSLDANLVRRDLGIIQLLTPPFSDSDLEPGYIKGYVPGVRENGGQYTHAAVWAAMAFAALGDTKRAWELAGMINPVRHGDSNAKVAVYKVEPYVVSADVYAVSPHGGRGGWSWYTGAAGWMYRLIVESLLGLRVEGNRMRLEPLLPAEWPEVTMNYRHGRTAYHITMHQTMHQAGADTAPDRTVLDGVEQGGPEIALLDDGHDHNVDVYRSMAVS